MRRYADHNEMGNFFAYIKAVYVLRTKVTAPLFSSDRQTSPTEKLEILERRLQHFRTARPQSDASIDLLPPVETKSALTSSLASQKGAETCDCSQVGSDAIPAEVYMHGDPRMMDKLKPLFQEI
ncbi:hypothetical protein SprV_0501907700 [Sparganum proliferum]